MNKCLAEKLLEYSKSDMYRFHMPGHKGRVEEEYYGKDITEIDGFDNLHSPQEVLKEAMDKASKIYSSRRTWYMVNGSTVGILAAVSALLKVSDTLLMARNCHKAVYNACYINKVKIKYIYPQFVDKYNINGGICVSDIEEALNCDNNIKAIFITSPTYEGVVSNICEIAEVAHKYNIPLIVDEAHGAHFLFGDAFPPSALQCGADVVIQSLHKTMSSLTQTALLHTSNESLVDDEEISKYLSIYQTSSPSYLLMESIEKCLNEVDRKGFELFKTYENCINKFYEWVNELKNIKVVGSDIEGEYGVWRRDIGKIVISVKRTDKSGKWLYDKLRKEYNMQPEMSASDYVICMTSYMDNMDAYERLFNALRELDKQVNVVKKGVDITHLKSSIVCEDMYNSMDKEIQERIRFAESVNRVSGEYIYLYPPGIPLIVPGEMITQEVIEVVNRYIEEGLNVQGPVDNNLEYLYVISK